MHAPPRNRPSLSVRRRLAAIALWLASPACASPPAEAVPVAAPFDAPAAYAEFERTLREGYAYLDRDDFDVEAHLARVRVAAVQTTDARSLRRLLQRACLAFTDPHLLVGPLEDADPNVWPTSADLALTLDAGRHVVADVRAGSDADAAGVRPGWQVLAIDGAAIEVRVAALLADVPSPTGRQRSYAATIAANGTRAGGSRALQFAVDGQPRTLALANPRALARRVAELEPLSVDTRDRVCIVRIHNSLGRNATIAAFDEAMRTCAARDAVILDLRNTPSGGNTDVARAILGHFVGEPRPYQVHEIPAVERRTTVPRRFVEYVLPRAPHFAGRVAVLGGRWTGSMGEGLVIGMQGAAGARTFTSDLGDLLGALHSQDLPASGATLELGVEALFHIDGTPRAACVGDVQLASADRDADGGDPAMTAALAWLTADEPNAR